MLSGPTRVARTVIAPALLIVPPVTESPRRLVTAWQLGSDNADDEISALTTSPTDDALYISGPLRAFFGASFPNGGIHLRPVDDPDAFTIKLT